MRKSISYIAFSILTVQVTYSQTAKPGPADLRGAQRIQVNTEVTSLRSPAGFGRINEFPIDSRRSRHYFKEERNTRWFLMVIPYSGQLTFKLTPHSIRDDYDWMLYKNTPGLEQDILAGTAVPVRTNNSRNDPAAGSATGLREGFEHDFTAPGPNPSFSRPLKAKKEEQYYLVIDNIYDKGQGFTLRVDLKPTFDGPFQAVEGHVRDRTTNQPVIADIVFEDDSTSFLISRTRSDSSGYYTAMLPVSRPVNGTAMNPAYLYGTDELFISPGDTTPVDFLLDSIRRGNRVIMYNIHFEPNKDIILPNSSSDLERLLAFLKREEDWTIRIIGHSNNNVFADAGYLQKLSFNRAVSVKRYLVNNGISPARISCAGMGGKSPLVETKDPMQGLKNLRVEIVLERQI